MADAADLLLWKLVQDLPQELLEVGGAAVQDGGQASLLETQLDLRPHALNRVVFWGVGHIEDDLDLIILQELCHLLTVVHAAVVCKDHKLGGLG